MNESDSQELVDLAVGVDKKKEIFNLWYEVVFLRTILGAVVANNPHLTDLFNENFFNDARTVAKKVVQEKFPLCNISFKDPEIK